MREEVLKRIGINVIDEAKIRVFVDTDCKNEADDQFALVHFLLTPKFEICGVNATHFEAKAHSKKSMLDSYKEIKKVLELAEMEDVNCYKGSTKPINEGIEESEGALAIIKEAKKKGKLFIACLGALTNVATALTIDSSISDNICILWNGGHPYSSPRPEFNVMQDIKACQIVLESDAEIWQIPQDVYSKLEVSLAELKLKVFPYGKIGNYLYSQLEIIYKTEYNPFFLLRSGENWTLGDNSLIFALIINQYRDFITYRKAPKINDNGLYEGSSSKKMIKVFTDIDVRFTLEDFFSKLALVYKD